ncbi:3'-phosphoadenosine 5'-phosphosulfate sulfotransferase [Ophidiomyces ophidiicola]|nr:3'-phosphoadenosine 5'-phosphosulfate sulfotransferase [Ophidiomyces ophidiicola]KAI1988685.1 3'-phosphoadenosine 5'-phosphosulfate sulfotransferase [Ophidiomyces ophidiicola]KAI1989381.1 3'-phosphoadenosine 5'-phosphosulfate sulfotransferase [Ophidiomyces ophidiicola]KAI1990983.1 3'-phosphoadenosine 5'-phosphosulfate sulfotransferase [Ophidiomyces ophidiicola]
MADIVSSSVPNGESSINSTGPPSRAAKEHPASRYPDTHDRAVDEPLLPSLASVSASLHAKIEAFLSESHPPSSRLHLVQQKTTSSLEVIQEALSKFKLRELSLSYNGGKDCLVLLVLFLSCLHPLPEPSPVPGNKGEQRAFANPSDNSLLTQKELEVKNDSEPPTSIPAIYARPSHPFPSVEAFVDSSSRIYHLSLTRYTPTPHVTLRDTFASYLEKYPGIKAIFVGTRRTDPYGENLTPFKRTDQGWPDFVRIHPVLHWNYRDIWTFIRHLGVEYCSLYDEGYTSLGGTDNTRPNPTLRVSSSPNENPTYQPAYNLLEDALERLGRD